MSAPYVLFGTAFSLYTAKLRAYLQLKNIPFVEKLATRAVYKKQIVPNTGVRIIPVLLTPQGQYLQDTAVIIEYLEALYPQTPILPPDPSAKLVAMLFELWADEWLLIPAMHYRWNKANFPFLYQEFGRVLAPLAPRFIRGFLGKKLAAKFSGMLPILGINTNTTAAIEAWYEGQFLPQLDMHFSQHAYLLGNTPCLADVALMGPLYAHLYRDPAPGLLMGKHAPHLVAWIERMLKQPAPATRSVNAIGDEAVPTTLVPILQSMFQQQWPELRDTVRKVADYAVRHLPTKPLPRSLGLHAFSLDGVTSQRGVFAFSQWKLQRVVDCYQGFDEHQKIQVNELLTQVDGLAALQIGFTQRVERRNNRLYYGDQL
ncbi:MAG: glutathione S-transferase family protein [Paraglaciecola sp.]|nr:glutathione S-transferase family protein [Paraglaciecola sp.]NCT46855.1 glutathione S-transferase family protein [Paraglaciecola sp.]